MHEIIGNPVILHVLQVSWYPGIENEPQTQIRYSDEFGKKIGEELIRYQTTG